MFSVCPVLTALRTRGLGGGGCCCCCWCALDGGVGSLRVEEGGVTKRTRGLGVTMSLRAGLLTIGVSLRFELLVLEPVAVEFSDPVHCILFDGEVPAPACFFAMAAQLSTLLMAFLAPGSSSREEAIPNSLGVSMLRLAVASNEFASCVLAPLLLTPSNHLREFGLPLVLIRA